MVPEKGSSNKLAPTRVSTAFYGIMTETVQKEFSRRLRRWRMVNEKKNITQGGGRCPGCMTSSSNHGNLQSSRLPIRHYSQKRSNGYRRKAFEDGGKKKLRLCLASVAYKLADPLIYLQFNASILYAARLQNRSCFVFDPKFIACYIYVVFVGYFTFEV
ncbi:LOW QUALITY PROTEIN: hypothetical protein OSB04_027632 [Centaurea solstitialis]|uniref:Uncharacterized protein n=1 Tax=Centaurea solstitialis TaxID=347529 RepID=A0AA38SSI1_9ASTR|nr:LOW QUALITY PROTEIN: hypothetical protein OSB04_027632 [Centaurea solstitialis]